jgi:DNA-binding beta-propeller fold protein YncE
MLKFQSIFATITVSVLSLSIASGQEDFTKNVDPAIGNVSQLLAPTYPTFSLPNKVIHIFPVKPENSYDQATSKKSIEENFTPLYDAPDQAIWHAKSRTWFVSNLGGGISLKKDKYGWITQTDEKGNVIHEFWIGKTEGMHAPSGMTITNDYLYVCDRDGVYEINIAKRKINNFFTISGASFINDVAIADNGDLFVSDFFGNKIYKLPQATRIPEVWLETDLLKTPDGLYINNNNLIVASWGKLSNPETFETSELGDLLSIDLKTKKIEILLSKIGNLEGITKAGKYYYVTDWFAGKVLKIDPKQKKVIDFISGLKNPTDLNYSPELNVIAIPQHGTNQVLFVNLSK